MGLDMYLYRKVYVQQWDHQEPERKFEVIVLKGEKPFEGVKPERITHIEEEVAYWRKANQIHRWFVDKCQDGNDDCGYHWVSEDRLRELHTICGRLLNELQLQDGTVVNGYSGTKDGFVPNLEPGKIVVNAELADDLLPSQEGFFFGGTDYDEYYLYDIEYTFNILTQILREHDNASDGTWYDYYYHSSW